VILLHHLCNKLGSRGASFKKKEKAKNKARREVKDRQAVSS